MYMKVLNKQICFTAEKTSAELLRENLTEFLHFDERLEQKF